MDTIEQNTSGLPISITEKITLNALNDPYGVAMMHPSGRDNAARIIFSLQTFKMLNEESDVIAHQLEEAGLVKGMRTLVFMEPGPDQTAVFQALFKIGAVPVIISPGLSRSEFLQCVKDASAEAFIGSPRGHLSRLINTSCFNSVSTVITMGRFRFWKGHLVSPVVEEIRAYSTQPGAPDESALIFYTQGITGRPKGVIHTVQTLGATLSLLNGLMDFKQGDTALCLHPFFAILFPAMGITSITPPLDLNYPLEADMERLTGLIRKAGVTHIMASPAFFSMMGGHLAEMGLSLPSIRKIICFGAQVIPEYMADFMATIPEDASMTLCYGSTEAFPVSAFDIREMFSDTKHLSEKGFGICVGKPMPECQTGLIPIRDEVFSHFDADFFLPDGEVGELAVQGDHVSRRYFENPDGEANAKMKGPDQTLWHRTGDLAWRDKKGRLWLCGRKSSMVKTAQGPLYALSCETIFNTHPEVQRSALVGIGDSTEKVPVVIVELRQKCGKKRKAAIFEELFDIAKENGVTSTIDTILFHDALPVDGYHLTEIMRDELVAYAQKQVQGHVQAQEEEPQSGSKS